MIRGDPVAFGILASVLHWVGSAERHFKTSATGALIEQGRAYLVS